MNQSLKSVIALVILVTLGTSVLGWTTRGIEGVPDSRFWMRASGIILVPAVWLLIWSEFRRDRAPDFLRRHAKKYFERDGFCFSVRSSVKDGRFAWQILFQNRYERPCKALVAFRPSAQLFGRNDLGHAGVEIDCDGGAFGVATIPYGIPSNHQGKKQQFDLIAVTQFPGGKGKMLRFRDGMAVGKQHKSGLDTAVTALSVLALHPHFTHAATFKLRLPDNVQGEASGAVQQQILWRPGDPDTID
jgi:hypothetical protein